MIMPFRTDLVFSVYYPIERGIPSAIDFSLLATSMLDHGETLLGWKVKVLMKASDHVFIQWDI